MLIKVLAIARLLATLAKTQEFQDLIALLLEAFQDREPLFGSSVGNAEADELKALCAENGVSAADCDTLCDKICA